MRVRNIVLVLTVLGAAITLTSLGAYILKRNHKETVSSLVAKTKEAIHMPASLGALPQLDYSRCVATMDLYYVYKNAYQPKLDAYFINSMKSILAETVLSNELKTVNNCDLDCNKKFDKTVMQVDWVNRFGKADATQYLNDYRACRTRGFGLMISDTFTMHSNQQGADHCVEIFLAFCLVPNGVRVRHNTLKGCRRYVLKSGYMGNNFYEELKLYSTYAIYEQLLQHFII